MFSKKKQENKFSEAECWAALIVGGLMLASAIVGCAAPVFQTKTIVEKFTEAQNLGEDTVYNLIAADRTYCRCTRQEYIETAIGTKTTSGYWYGTPKLGENQ